MFVELPDGRLINAGQVKDVLPLSGGHYKLVWANGAYEDIGGENAEILRRGLRPKAKREMKPKDSRK